MPADQEAPRGGSTPEEMVAAGRRMEEAREKAPAMEVSVESALQLKGRLEDKDRAKDRLLGCNDLSEVQQRAVDYVEAAKAAKSAAGVVEMEAGIFEPAIEYIPPGQITSRG